MKANNQKRPDGLKKRNSIFKSTVNDIEMQWINSQSETCPLKNVRNLTCSNCGTLDTPLWRRDPVSNDITCNACGLYYRIHNHHRPSAWNENFVKRMEKWDETIKEGAESLISLHSAAKPALPGFHRHHRSYSFNGPQLISPPSSPSAPDDGPRYSPDYIQPLPSPTLPPLEMNGTSEATKSMKSLSIKRIQSLGVIPSFQKIGKSRHSKTSSDLTSYAFSYRAPPPVRPKFVSRHSHSKSEIVLPASKKMSITNMLT